MYKISNISKDFIEHSWLSLLKIKKPFKKNALTKINLDVPRSGIIGLYGPNGSGKSTILKIISGLLTQDEGIIDPSFEKLDKSYVSGNDRSFFWRLSVRQNLLFFGQLHNLKKEELNQKIAKLSKRFDLLNILDNRFMSLSSGNKRKVSIVRALLRDSELTLFDEITNSLDNESKAKVLIDISKACKNNNSLIFWATHDVSELEQVADKVVVLKNGACEKIIDRNNNGKLDIRCLINS